MQKIAMYYEWVVWFRDGNIIAQHERDGTEVPWRRVIDYHVDNSKVQRAAFVPFTAQRAINSSVYYKRFYDEEFERNFHATWIKHTDDFVAPVEPHMNDKNIQRNIDNYNRAMIRYNSKLKAPMTEMEWRQHTYRWKDNCISRVMPSHFVEAINDSIPFVSRRLEFGYFGGKQDMTYYYILGSGGRKVKDDNGNIHYIDGYYQAIDKNGHTRLCHYSNVVVPVVPPERADTFELQVNEID